MDKRDDCAMETMRSFDLRVSFEMAGRIHFLSPPCARDSIDNSHLRWAIRNLIEKMLSFEMDY